MLPSKRGLGWNAGAPMDDKREMAMSRLIGRRRQLHARVDSLRHRLGSQWPTVLLETDHGQVPNESVVRLVPKNAVEWAVQYINGGATPSLATAEESVRSFKAQVARHAKRSAPNILTPAID